MMFSTTLKSLVFVGLLISVESVRTTDFDAQEPDEVEEVGDSCQDSDCQYSLGKGCAPKDPDSGFKCIYQYKFGDITPSMSCRCGGAALLKNEYGSIEEAFAALSQEGTKITEIEFEVLMGEYNVPPYTADFEFRKADVNKDGSLSKDEFVKAAEQLMASTEGGDTSVGSAGSRCCCKKEKEMKVVEADICVNEVDLQVFSRRVVVDESNSFMNPEYTRKLEIKNSGKNCRHKCSGSRTEQFIVHPWGQGNKHSSGQNDGQYLEIGNALYVPANQSYPKCVHFACTSHRSTRRVRIGQHTSIRRTCVSGKTCMKHIDFEYCGHGLKHYVKVGTVGTCVPEEDLVKKWFVGHKTCPSGMYHSKRINDHVGVDGLGGMQMCDCSDKCP
eukprot:TRINITY_DN9561_c0_g1_i1.p1 TRINITY_DN9561_c0_g1~~TRINITY_DN9561_c0_g1_i1.p1  ORF type:complete len:386 (-),score=71.73 TRINITY_DN9561_c0_g1_i1:169-1326(-)